MAAYKIGNFTFDTEEEYARGLEDAKKIEKIQSTVDLNEPETALRLYWLIRTGTIRQSKARSGLKLLSPI